MNLHPEQKIFNEFSKKNKLISYAMGGANPLNPHCEKRLGTER
jgi:hypothetical protein